MFNLNDLVRKAMAECADEFVRGVASNNPDNPDVVIPPKLVVELKNDRNLMQTFTELFREDPKRWEHDGPVVCRSAFHAGSLAALHAYSKGDSKVVTRRNVIDALKHISDICTAGIRIQHKYCRLLPSQST